VRDPKTGQNVIREDSSVKNVNSAKRTLPVNTAVFEVKQGERGNARITIPDEYLAWGEKVTTRSAKPINFDLNRPLEVYQVFSLTTSPIKEVEALEMYYNSHRTANLALVPAKQFASTDATAAPAAPTGPTSGGLGGPAGSGGVGSGGDQRGAGGPGGNANGNLTPNGLVKNRYIAVTDQVRHMPVALELVVDQSYVQDVLTAVANSRLRIQITQVQWQRAWDYKLPRPGETVAGGPGMVGPAFPPGGGSMRPPASGGGDMRPGMGSSRPPSSGGMGAFPSSGGRGGAFPGSGGAVPGRVTPPAGGVMPPGAGLDTPSAVAPEDSDPNLVHVAVYGIASLYERYPPKPPEQAGATGEAPAAPAPAK
jgi:hypothetical protein